MGTLTVESGLAGCIAGGGTPEKLVRIMTSRHLGILFRLFLVSSVALLLSSSAVSAEPSKKPISPMWDLVARSDVIARAKLDIPLAVLKASLDTRNYAYIDLRVDIEETIKGSLPPQPVAVRYFTGPREYSPTAGFLESYNGKEVIVFLLQVDKAGVPGNYFAGATPSAVGPFIAEEFSTVAREVKQQAQIVRQFDELPIGKTAAADALIRELFEGLTSKASQAATWERLLKLSREDAPAIVRVMDDQRPLAERYAYVPTPDSFEATAQYGPPRIVEAASILLAYLTETSSFRDVYNGGSERERQADVDGWRVWCAYNF